MSEVMTVVRLPGCFGAGLMEYGRLTRAEIIAKFRAYAAEQKAQAEAVLAADDSAFDARIVRGVHVQHLIEKLEPDPVQRAREQAKYQTDKAWGAQLIADAMRSAA